MGSVSPPLAGTRFPLKIEKGFPKGDDAFDAVVGLFGTIEVAKAIPN